MVDAHVRDAPGQRGAEEVQRALHVADEVRVAQRVGPLGEREPIKTNGTSIQA